jgi:hypothetical protein
MIVDLRLNYRGFPLDAVFGKGCSEIGIYFGAVGVIFRVN